LAASLLQTEFWGRLKGQFGWKSLFLSLNIMDREIKLLVLIRKVMGPFSLAYVPFGPAYPGEEEQKAFLKAIKGEVRKALPPFVIALRFDLHWPRQESIPTLIKAPVDVQPPDTVILNLDSSEESLLMGMKKKTRYNVKLALKKGVEIRDAGIESLDYWYRMYQETAQRDQIAIHSQEYYRAQFELAQKDPQVDYQLLLAYHEEDLLAGIILARYDERTTYLYGASSNIKRNMMPAYLLQWEAIKRAKAQGCREYDFFGIPPAEDPNHPMNGLYRFKVGFGGEVRHLAGCWDYPVNPVLYLLYTLAERVRYLYFKKLRKR